VVIFGTFFWVTFCRFLDRFLDEFSVDFCGLKNPDFNGESSQNGPSKTTPKSTQKWGQNRSQKCSKKTTKMGYL